MTRVALERIEFARAGGFHLGPISLVLAAGSRLALVGPSGSGKTTFLRLVAGLEPLRGGRILLDGREVAGAASRARETARAVGFVFQSGALWPHMTALEHLRFVAPDLGRAGVRALLERVGLGGKERRRPAELSGGEGQRLALARALAPGPSLLLLDEPLHSLDVHLRDDLSLLLREVAAERGLTLVVVTHDRAEALALADQLAVLNEGVLLEHGPTRDLLRAPRTAFTARFLCQAACMATEETSGGRLATPFGEAPRPPGAGPFVLALLPGDLVVAGRGGEAEAGGGAGAAGSVRGEILHVEPDARGVVARVRVAGATATVFLDQPLAEGQEVTLRLAGAPRVLMDGVPRQAAGEEP